MLFQQSDALFAESLVFFDSVKIDTPRNSKLSPKLSLIFNGQLSRLLSDVATQSQQKHSEQDRFLSSLENRSVFVALIVVMHRAEE